MNNQMTYKDLLKKLEELTPEQLEQPMKIYDSYEDKFSPGELTFFVDNGIIENDYPVIIMY